MPTCPCTFDVDAGEPSVPPDLGGPGFTGEGWQTATEILALGNITAPKGGTATLTINDWPATLRVAGAGWNSEFNSIVSSVCYESLVNVHPVTLELMPGLASHWQITDDKMTYRFRINPRARWSDGREVTANDVVATIKLKCDPSANDVSALILSNLEPPRAMSKYMLEVRAKVVAWRNFIDFATTSILPAHEIGSIDGTTFLDRYQFKLTAVSGPYEVRPDDILPGTSIALTRRQDYWGKNQCFARGLWNIDRIRYVVVKDENLAFEKLKAGEIDIFGVNKAQWWAEEVDKIDGVRRGLIQKRKIFTDTPIGVRGIAINTRLAPLDDRRVRLALCHLLNRKLMLEKLYFNEYAMLYSYFPGGIYQNPGNQPTPYDPAKADTLLVEAGWTERDPKGIRVRDGRRLEFAVQYDSKLNERFLTIFQEDCLRAGIELDLQLVNPSTRWKNVMDRQFEMAVQGWSGLVFPNPELICLSTLADEKGNNNLTGMKDPEIDSLCRQYDLTFETQKRMRLVHQIDAILFDQHHYVLTWYTPNTRLLYWNKFGHPDWYITRTGDTVPYSWWIDADLERQVERGKTDRNVILPKGATEVHFWEHYGDRSEPATASSF